MISERPNLLVYITSGGAKKACPIVKVGGPSDQDNDLPIQS